MTTKPKQWTGRKEQPKKQTGRKSAASRRHEEAAQAAVLVAPVEPIPDEVEVQDEQTTLGDST